MYSYLLVAFYDTRTYFYAARKLISHTQGRPLKTSTPYFRRTAPRSAGAEAMKTMARNTAGNLAFFVCGLVGFIGKTSASTAVGMTIEDLAGHQVHNMVVYYDPRREPCRCVSVASFYMQLAEGINELHVEKHLPMLLGLRPPDLLSSTGLCIFSSGTVPFALGMTRRHPVHESLAKRGRYFVSLSFSRVIVMPKLVSSVACCFSSLLFSHAAYFTSPCPRGQPTNWHGEGRCAGAG